MSFLDNLENNLKSLESSGQAEEDAARARRTREEALERARAEAPFADALRDGPFTAELLKQATRIGFSLRTKVHFVWLGTTLRLEARERRLELRPTPQGIVAVYLQGAQELRQEPLDLSGKPEELVRNWLNAG
jgi:hypothetical protein